MVEFLAVGIINNVHGLKGEFKVKPLTDDIRRFNKLKKVFIKGKEYNVSWCKLQPQKVIVKIEGIDTVEEAMKYKNEYMEVDRANAIELPEGRYFVVDIIGCNVVDENGKDEGVVKDVIFTGSNDVYWAIREGREDLLIPVIDPVVQTIDIDKKVITIEPVEKWM